MEDRLIDLLTLLRNKDFALTTKLTDVYSGYIAYHFINDNCLMLIVGEDINFISIFDNEFCWRINSKRVLGSLYADEFDLYEALKNYYDWSA